MDHNPRRRWDRLPLPLIGRAIEDLVEAYALLTAGGRITSLRPSSDIDHKDFIFDERGGYLSVYLQVKGVTQVSQIGEVRIQVRFRKGRILSSPRFLYLFVLIDPKTVEIVRMWLIPSVEFNRLAPRAKAPVGYVVLPFVSGRPTGRGKWDRFLIDPKELGVKLLSAIHGTEHAASISQPIPASIVMRAKRIELTGVSYRREPRSGARRPARRASSFKRAA